jgi:hypothetical protein
MHERGVVTMRKHEGMALVMALVIVLLGSALISAMFDLSSAFTKTMSFERRGYVEHVAMTDYLEKAKGFIINTNNGRGLAGVLHGPGVTLSDDITSLADLQLTQAELSVDMTVQLGNGARRLVLRTYDANYRPSRVNISDWANKKDFPPSLKLDFNSIENGADLELGGTDVSNPDIEAWRQSQSQAYRDYGAYVVRVELYHNNGGRELLERDIEEGFFQAINQ